METSQTLTQAKNDAIILLETSIATETNLLDMEVAAGLITQDQYRSRMNTIHNERRKLLILKGELPSIVNKKRFRNGVYV